MARLTAPPDPKGILNRLTRRSLRPGVDVVGGQLVVDEAIFEEDPLNLLTIFADAQLIAIWCVLQLNEHPMRLVARQLSS